MVSAVAKKIIGIFIADDKGLRPSTVAWAQEECRHGSLRQVVDSFVSSQDEPLDAELLLVEKFEESGIMCRIPCKIFDHESPHAFRVDVRLRIDPTRRVTERLAD